MEDKADKTFFADESKDPFTFGNSEIYKKMNSNKKQERREKGKEIRIFSEKEKNKGRQWIAEQKNL